MPLNPDLKAVPYTRQTPSVLCAEAYPDVEALMLGERPRFSFTQQMAKAVGSDPTAFLVTANSAIPIADSIRGFYEELDADLPVIDYIRVPRHSLFRNLSDYIEKRRLKNSLGDASENVFVIDEYVLTGETLTRAHNLLSSIGIGQHTDIIGRWYGHAKRPDIDMDRLTSSHAKKMREIGRTAAQLAY